jgi:hypothetical protein
MNINPRAAQAHLGFSHVFRGVDAILQQAPGTEMLLDSSSDRSDSSDSTSDASSASPTSRDDTASHPSLMRWDDDSSISSIWSGSSQDSIDGLFEELTPPQFSSTTYPSDADGTYQYNDYDMFYDDGDFGANHHARDRSANHWEYIFGDYLDRNYVRKFLCDDIRAITYVKSRDKNSVFRSHFRVPLSFIDSLTEMFITRGWVRFTKRCHSEYKLSIRTQLFIMCALEHLGNRRPHRQLETETICFSEHQAFFDTFLDRMYSRRFDNVVFPSRLEG